MPLYKMDFGTFQGFQVRPRFFHIIPLQNGPSYFWGFSLFQVAILLKCPHFVEASGSENHKSAPKKGGWVPWFCRALLHLWQVLHSVEAWGPKKSDLALQNGDTQPPQVIFWGYLIGPNWDVTWQHVTAVKYVQQVGKYIISISSLGL